MMHATNSRRRLAFLGSMAAALVTAALVVGMAPSQSGPGPELGKSPYQMGMEAMKAGDYAKALTLFQQADKAKKNDPDTMNMTAFCLRKTGRLEDARDTYLKALKIKPNFPQAREYLGENYLDLAKEQLKVLAGYGKDGTEQHAQLKQAVLDWAAELEGKPIDPSKPRSNY